MADASCPTEIPCEGCGKHVPGIRSTALLTIVFLLLFAYIRNDSPSLCPPCARVALVRGALINLFTANLLWPVVLIWNSVAFMGTFFRPTSWEIPDDPDPGRRMR
jgi:hypothetical protein